MAHDEEQLAPETIEEQLDHLAQALHFMPPGVSKTPGMQVVEALQGVYAEERQADAGSLDRVWDRLMLRQQHAAPVRRLPDTRERRSRVSSIWLPRSEGIISRLGVLAAVALLVLLVGSISAELMVLGMHQNHPNSGATAVPNQVTPPTAGSSVPIIAPSHPQTVYRLAETHASPTREVLERSTDGGASWHSFSLPAQSISGWQSSLFVSPLDAERVFVTLTGQLVKTTCTLEQPAGGTGTGPATSTPCSMQYLSQDGGIHWTPVQLPLQGSLTDTATAALHIYVGDAFTPIFTLEAQEDRLYAALVPWGPRASGARLVTSTDGGLTWQLADARLASAGNQICDVMPAPTGATVFVLTALDCIHSETTPLLLWQSADAGAHWTKTSQFTGNADLGMAVVSSGAGTQPLLYLDYLSNGSSACALRTSSALSPQAGICGGAPTDVQVSADGGRTWHTAPAQGYPYPDRTPGSPLGVLSDGSVLFLVDRQFYAWKSSDSAWRALPAVSSTQPQYALLTSTSAGHQTLWVVTATFTIHSTTYAIQQYQL